MTEKRTYKERSATTKIVQPDITVSKVQYFGCYVKEPTEALINLQNMYNSAENWAEPDRTNMREITKKQGYQEILRIAKENIRIKAIKYNYGIKGNG